MRTTLLYCSVALLSISWLSGCGIMQNGRGGCPLCGAPADGASRNRVAAKGKPDAQAAPRTASAKKRSALPVVASQENHDSIEVLPIVNVGEIQTPEILPIIPSTPMRMPVQERLNETVTIKADPPTQTKINLPAEEPTKAKELTVPVKSVDVHYGHTVNFESVTGQVQAWRKTWRLRYAAVDQEDMYGGSVVLEGGADLNQLRDGLHVRVRGTLTPSTDRTGAPIYRVQAIEILD